MPKVAKKAHEAIQTEHKRNIVSKIITGDSRNIDLSELLSIFQIKKVQFIIMHPPYWDIIKFSDNKNDLSNTLTLGDFLDAFGEVIENTSKYLERYRYLACVIGDKYMNGQVVPLGFHCMNKFLEKGFLLKAILVKNFGETRGKAGNQGIWRYRAIANDFYIFKHEYIFVFKKLK